MRRLVLVVSVVAACGRTELAPDPLVQCEVDADCAVTRVPACGGCATLCPPAALPLSQVSSPLDGCPTFECRVLDRFRYAPACVAGACVAVAEPVN